MGLSCAKDEIYWLLRHNDNPPLQKGKGKTTEDLVDRQLPELLFHMEELRSMYQLILVLRVGAPNTVSTNYGKSKSLI